MCNHIIRWPCWLSIKCNVFLARDQAPEWEKKVMQRVKGGKRVALPTLPVCCSARFSHWFFLLFYPIFLLPPLPPLAHPKVCFDLKQGQDLARGGDSHTKVTGMLVFSLRAVNCRFWSHLGCLGWKVTILAHPGIAKKFTKNALTLTTQKYPFKIEVSLSLNSLNHTYIGLP